MDGLNITGLIERKRIDAVEVQQLPDGSHLMHHIALGKKGHRLNVISMHPSITSMQELNHFIPMGAPVVLVITGKGVLMRSVSAGTDTTHEELVKSVFPDARHEDFLLSRESLADNGTVLCLTRTILAETIVKKFFDQKIQITEVLVGPLTITGILPMVESATSFVFTGQYFFHYTKNRLVEAQTSGTEPPADVKVGELTLPGVMLCPFAAAFDFMIINRFNPTTPLTLVREKAQEVRILSKVKGGMVISLAVLFFILVVNFLLFDHFTKKYNQQASVVEENQSAVRKADSLNELILQREQFLKQSSGTGNRKSSFIIDRIGASMPAGINLTEITVHPILFKEDETNKEPVYQPHIVRVCAMVKESSALNRWIKQLEGLEWVESVAFSNYHEKEEQNAGVTLEITIK
jgi:hypothetical protein